MIQNIAAKRVGFQINAVQNGDERANQQDIEANADPCWL
jgi:hypothetical protein